MQDQIIPLQKKVMKLKQAIYDFHIRAGCTVNEANYFMLVESGRNKDLVKPSAASGKTVSVATRRKVKEMERNENTPEPNLH